MDNNYNNRIMFFIHKKTADLIPIPQSEQKIIKQLDISNEEEQISVIRKLLSLKKEYWLKCTCNDNAILVICSIDVRNYTLTLWIVYLPKIESLYPLKNYGNIPIKKSKDTIFINRTFPSLLMIGLSVTKILPINL